MRYANVLIESYSSAICLTIALYLYFHRNVLRRQKNWFLVMLISNILMSAGDMTDWIFSGNPSPAAGFCMNMGMVLYFASSGVLLASYSFYILVYMEENFRNAAAYISAFLGVVQVLCAVGSPWTGAYFYIDSSHVYHRGPLFALSQVTAMIVYVVQMAIVFRGRKKLQGRDVLFLSGFIIFPVAGEVSQVFFYDIALLNVAVTFALLLIFINVQSNQEFRIQNAEARAEAKSNFLASMSHEIRTPINAVLGMNEIIMRESHEKEIIEYAENINSAGKKLLGIINDILDFSKIESKKMDIVIAPYHLSSLINDLYHMTIERANKKGLEFRVDVSPEIPEMLIGDEVRLNQIILNLLTNAVKYTKKGFVELSVSHESRQDDIAFHVDVRDSGLGIRREDISRLFDSFQRVDEQKTRSIEGTGLGLSIVKQLVDLMDGKIYVESEYGTGSVFSVIIPQRVLSSEPIGDFRERIQNSSPQIDYKTGAFVAPGAAILAVDDNSMNLKVLSGLLARTRILVDLAGSGAEVLEMIGKKQYDLVMLDHRMPGMDGVETLGRIKEKNILNGAPVIALTANAFPGAKELYVGYGFQDYLSKPVNSAQLEKLLMDWLPKEKILKWTPEQDGAANQTEDARGTGDGSSNQTRNVRGDGGGAAEDRFSGLRQLLDLDEAREYAGDDDEMLGMNLMFFCENAPVLDAELSEDYEKMDLDNYGIHVHALKSNAATVGASGLAGLAKELEAAAKAQDREKIREQHGKLIEMYHVMVSELRERGFYSE